MPVRGWLKSAERRPDQNNFIKVLWWALFMKQNLRFGLVRQFKAEFAEEGIFFRTYFLP